MLEEVAFLYTGVTIAFFQLSDMWPAYINELSILSSDTEDIAV